MATSLSLITESNKVSISSLYLISFLSDISRPLFPSGPLGMHNREGILRININSYLFLSSKVWGSHEGYECCLLGRYTWKRPSASRTS